MSNRDVDMPATKKFEAFSSSLVKLNLKGNRDRKKFEINMKVNEVNDDENDIIVSDNNVNNNNNNNTNNNSKPVTINNLLDKLKEQNEKIKNLGLETNNTLKSGVNVNSGSYKSSSNNNNNNVVNKQNAKNMFSPFGEGSSINVEQPRFNFNLNLSNNNKLSTYNDHDFNLMPVSQVKEISLNTDRNNDNDKNEDSFNVSNNSLERNDNANVKELKNYRENVDDIKSEGEQIKQSGNAFVVDEDDDDEENERKEREERERKERERKQREERERKERERKERIKREKEERERKEREERERKEREEREQKLKHNNNQSNFEIEDIEDYNSENNNNNNSLTNSINNNNNNNNNEDPIPEHSQNFPIIPDDNPISNSKSIPTTPTQHIPLKLKVRSRPPKKPDQFQLQEINQILKSNEKQLNELKPIPRQTIEDIITNIIIFDTANPDLSDINTFTEITTFTQHEPTLPDIIPNFTETITDKEGAFFHRERRNDFLSGVFYKNKIKEYSILTECIKPSKAGNYYTELMTAFKSFKGVLLDDFATLNENAIFENNTINESCPMMPIGYVQSLETFCYKYSTHENIPLMKDAYTHCSYWRECLLDGDSFYRTFMFSLLEQLILENNLTYLKAIIYEMSSDEHQKLYRSLDIDDATVFSIFKLILIYLENENDITKALRLLYKAYTLKSKCFDSLLVIYCRHLFYKHIKLLFDYCDRSNISKYKIKDKYKMNVESIKQRGIEPYFFYVIFAIYLFNCKINFFIIDEKFYHSSTRVVLLNYGSNEENVLDITIGGFYYGYYPLYSKECVARNKVLVEYFKEKSPEITQLTFIIKHKDKQCNVCNKKLEQVVLFQQRCICCLYCLKHHIHNVIKKRMKCLYTSHFIGLECKYYIHIYI